jgi:hypothetical protein
MRKQCTWNRRQTSDSAVLITELIVHVLGKSKIRGNPRIARHRTLDMSGVGRVINQSTSMSSNPDHIIVKRREQMFVAVN